ncbi:nucleoporin subcomplex protein binding to Pom34-domain-containing protein [Radiomyces spectabilis]|uniref:nucleoporin subcomplex protein binding to Pom34-domain-containing protein n=1 Tax=Radiomyces spectabilis TaxID=64574 RepID=UPI002220C1CA|nr:nucleoporin subcomplex protein binding to Pom34-domain-containing protein [Radiomyces spectabilis]KAI8374397.1 nucleoporin subcomplex protein binding to Pom34-domain-containing protein [Radiomyces spectabilis]
MTSPLDEKFAGTYRKLFDTIERGQDQCSTDRLQTLLGEKSSQLALGLAAFTEPSSNARSKVTSGTVTISGHTIKLDKDEQDLVVTLSDLLKLNEVQTACLWEAYRNQLSDPPSTGAGHGKLVDDEGLIMAMIEFYYQDRLSLLRCISSLLRISYTEDHIYRHIAKDTIANLQNETKDGLDFIQRIFNQQKELVRQSVPSNFYSQTLLATIWANQNLREQKALLEIVFLNYLTQACPAERIVSFIQEFEASNFGMDQVVAYLLDKEGDLLRHQVSHLCILVTLAVMNIANFTLDAGLPQTPSEKLLVESPAAVTQINRIAAYLGEQKQHAPFLFAWSYVLSFINTHMPETEWPPAFADVKKVIDGEQDVLSTDMLISRPSARAFSAGESSGEQRTVSIVQTPDVYRAYAGRAIKLGIFEYLTTILNSDVCSQDDMNSYGYRCMIRDLLKAFFSVSRPCFLPPEAYDSLVTCTCQLYDGQSELCGTFWCEDFDNEESGSLLSTAKGRFPVNFTDLLRMLSSLSGAKDGSDIGKFSSEAVFKYLCTIPTMTVMVKDSAIIQLESNGDATVAMLEQALRVTGEFENIAGLVLPAQTKGLLLSTPDEQRVIQWRAEYSGWHLLMSVLASFIHQRRIVSSIDIEDFDDQLGGQKLEVVDTILQLIQRVLENNPTLSAPLVQHIEETCRANATVQTNGPPVLITLLCSILTHCSTLAACPVPTITATLQCLTALLPYYRNEIWVYLQSAPILPRPNTSHHLAARFSTAYSISTDPSSQIQHLVSKVEHKTGRYSLLIAFLDLVTALVRDVQRNWWIHQPVERNLGDFSPNRQYQVETLYFCLYYLMLDVFPCYANWRYKKLSERFIIGAKVLRILIEVAQYFREFETGDRHLTLGGLRDGIMSNFLYEGGAYHINPLLDTISDGATMANKLYQAGQLKEAVGAEKLTELTFVFVKLLLQRRVEMIQNGSELHESALERLLLERTTGTNSPDFLLRVAKHIHYRHQIKLPILATNVITLLCRTITAWKVTPDFVQYLGGTDQAHDIIRAYLTLAKDPSQNERLLTCIWQMITLLLETQPSLAILFLECGDYILPSPKSAVKLLQEQHLKQSNDTTGTQPMNESAVRAAVDILGEWQTLSVEKPTVLSNVLRFLATFWQTAFDHYALVQRARSDNALWHALEQILLNPNNVPVPQPTDPITFHKRQSIVGEHSDTMYEPSVSDQDAKVRRLCCLHVSKALALRIIAFELHLTSGLDTASRQASPSKVSERLPAGLKNLLTKLGEPSKLAALRSSYIENSYQPILVSAVQQNAESLVGLIGISDTSRLLCRIPPVGFGDDDAPGEGRQYGDSYLYDLRLAEARIQSLYRDVAMRYNGSQTPGTLLTPELLAVVEVRKMADRFISSLCAANHNFSIVDSEIILLRSFKLFTEIASSYVSDLLWSGKATTPGSSSQLEFLSALIQHAIQEKRDDGVALTAFNIQIHFIRGLTEDWIQSNQSILTGTDKTAKRQFADKAFELLAMFCALLRRENFAVMHSLPNNPATTCHRPLLEATMLCLRTLRGTYGPLRESNAVKSDLDNLKKYLSDILDVSCESFKVIVTEIVAYGASSTKVDQGEAEEYMKDLTVVIALLEELINPDYALPSTEWLPVFAKNDTVPTLLKLLHGGIDLVVSEIESQACATKGFHSLSISPYAETALYFLLALSNIQAAADHLVGHGVIDLFCNNRLSQQLKQGTLDMFIRFGDNSSNGSAYVERNPLHIIWCQMLGVSNNIARTLGHSEQVLRQVVGFVQAYGCQIGRAFDEANGANDTLLGLTPSESLSSCLLEEIDRITMLMFILSKHIDKLASYAANVFVAYKDWSLLLVQRYLYFFTHPSHMQAQLYPIDQIEKQLAQVPVSDPPSTTPSTKDVLPSTSVRETKTSQLMQLTIQKAMRIQRNILSALIQLTEADITLRAPEPEWPFGNVVISPNMRVAVGEAASFGTLIENINVGLNLVKQWQAAFNDNSTKKTEIKRRIRVTLDVIQSCFVLLTSQGLLWMNQPSMDEDARNELVSDNVMDIAEILTKVEKKLEGFGKEN